ncbi:MAG: hypothetical protein DBX47_06000 [Clostridiales bacterium]|nr:MAG: hypothetical protein DBX47_06000 [Clostridiales bacterium]
MGENKFITFRGRNLVRTGNLIFYGNMSDRYYTLLSISDQKKVKELPVATKIDVQLMYTDPQRSKEVIKFTTKNGLYQALDIASAWIDIAIADAGDQ